jgi:glycosyltransferase involved in cell wall biosynthesis
LRILHVIGSLDPRYGGPSTSTPRLCAELASRGHHVELLTTSPDGPAEMRSAGVAITCRRLHWPRGWAASAGLGRWLHRRVREFDVVHVHNLYRFHTWWTARCCRRAGVPYLVSPHGTLDPWHLVRHRRRKAAYTWLLDGRVLRDAAALHYHSSAEQEHAARHLGPLARGFVVPPGIDPPPSRRAADDGGLTARHPELAGRTLVCFLGRLTAKKRLDLLVEAFAAVAAADRRAHLAIAGPDDEGIGARTRASVASLGLDGRVSFLGLVTGAAKAALLERSRVLVLASEDESFGVAVAEAMAAGLPVVVSEGVALHRQVAAAEAGAVTALAPGPVAAAVLRFVKDSELAARAGVNGRALVREVLSWERTSAAMEDAYQQVVAGQLRGPASQRATGPVASP